MSFRIVYSNPKRPVPEPERYEGYDLESALYDYLPEGIGATVEVDGYSLELRMPQLKFVSLVRSCLPLAEQLSTLPPDDSEQIRRFIPELPSDAKVYSWLFVDFLLWLPTLLFAVAGENVWIYTRTLAEAEGSPLIVWEKRDLSQPVVVPRKAVIEELCSFLSRYLDDLSAAFPFIREDALYLDWRKRLGARV